jgi:asparagine synthetase B (glutamine-hydrolysing)
MTSSITETGSESVRLLRVSAVEAATDDAIGLSDTEPPLPPPGPLQPLAALESALRPALQRTPCLIQFSGGRDSSVLLAVAMQLARREGLPEPVPATLRFPGVPSTHESHWQEMVLRHLGITDWHRQTIVDSEMEMVGPIARGVLSRHGLLCPATGFFVVPLLEAAGEGTLVSGIDGDGLFNGGNIRAVMALKERPELRDPLRIAKALAPAALRRAHTRRDRKLSLSWLRPAAQAEFNARWAPQLASEPVRWDRYVAWFARLRRLLLIRQILAILATDTNTYLRFPLQDPQFLSSLGAHGGRTGWRDRTGAYRALFGHLLPRALIERSDKTFFTGVHWGPLTRDFVEQWNGEGLFPEIVDAEALREEWLKPDPDVRTGFLLHLAFVRSLGGDADHSLDRVLE